ncbi:MAG: DUF1570 domain-containing protein [Terriglobia bacterium]
MCWAAALARGAEKPQVWLELRSPHFTVFTNGNDKQARRVAQQMEQIRAVFHMAFPRARVDSGAPILVFAAKDEKTFKALEPAAWTQKGQAERTGMFQRGPEKNFVLLRLDVESEEVWHIVFHEYTHFLVQQDLQSLPLWLDEGLAEFYGNSRILDKEVWLGRPSGPHVLLLRGTPLIPLETLFKVDHSSSYYNEKNKGTIFYAESWALTHYLLAKRGTGQTNPAVEFVNLLRQDVDADAAARQAFGDLAKLQKELESYVRQASFRYLRLKSSPEVDEMQLTPREMSAAESAAARADFLAHLQENTRARKLLEEALKADSQNALAHESMGFLELQQGNLEEARKWFTRAVSLDSKSYLTHYYFATMALRETPSGETARQVEESFRAVMRLNPGFAPAYDGLAVFLMTRGERLEEARKLTLHAIELEPGNFAFRANAAGVLLRMDRVDDALRVAERALALAKTPEEQSFAQSVIESATKMLAFKAQEKERQERARVEEEAFKRRLDEAAAEAKTRAEHYQQEDAEAAAARQSASTAAKAKGVPGWSAGKIVAVSCKESPSLDLTLQGALNKLRLHAANYFKIEFLATSWKPPDPFNPCQDLQGHQAAITYRSFKGAPYDGEIVSVEVRK